jgi:antitoxin (DNA-binding transcriptional repressor) of toxin-antitoxin stability system
MGMKEIPATEFKATCLSVLQQVHKTRKPVRITRYGKVIAEIQPPEAPPKKKSWMGSMAGTFEITGDIVGPTFDDSDWLEP